MNHGQNAGNNSLVQLMGTITLAKQTATKPNHRNKPDINPFIVDKLEKQ
jgi:hypothetical protein